MLSWTGITTSRCKAVHNIAWNLEETVSFPSFRNMGGGNPAALTFKKKKTEGWRRVWVKKCRAEVEAPGQEEGPQRQLGGRRSVCRGETYMLEQQSPVGTDWFSLKCAAKPWPWWAELFYPVPSRRAHGRSTMLCLTEVIRKHIL